MGPDLFYRQSQERLANQLGMFGAPPLADHSLAGRHPDIDASESMFVFSGDYWFVILCYKLFMFVFSSDRLFVILCYKLFMFVFSSDRLFVVLCYKLFQP